MAHPDDKFIPDSPHTCSSGDPTGNQPPAATTAAPKFQALPVSSASTNKPESAMESNNATEPATLPGMPQLQPAADLSERFTMAGIHEKWQGVSTSTSKCDVCMENRRGILYMCRQCSRNVCTSCVQEGNLGDIREKKHRFDPANVVWKAPQSRAKKSKPAAKKATAAGRVTKTTKSSDKEVKGQETEKGATDNHTQPHSGHYYTPLLAVEPRTAPLGVFRGTANQQSYTQQPRFYQAPQQENNDPRMSNPRQAQEYQIPPNAGSESANNDTLAASALTTMRGGNLSEEGGPSSSSIYHQEPVAHPCFEQYYYQPSMQHRPQADFMLRPQRSARFEPYENAKRLRQMNDANLEKLRSRDQSPFVIRPSPLSPAMGRPHQSPPSQSQPECQQVIAQPDDASYVRSTRSSSVSPETVAQTQASSTPHDPRPVAESTQSSASRPALLAPIISSEPQSAHQQSTTRLPPFQQFVQGASPHVAGRPIPRSVPERYYNQQPAEQLYPHRAPATYYRPPPDPPRIHGPPCSPLTGEEFPPARTNGEAYGQWQVFKVHSDLPKNPNVQQAEAYLLHYTSALWDHLLKQQSQIVADKFRVVLSATAYATNELEIKSMNNQATRWLKGLEEALVEQGFQIQRSFLDELRVEMEKR